jgi:hypothetical protein
MILHARAEARALAVSQRLGGNQWGLGFSRAINPLWHRSSRMILHAFGTQPHKARVPQRRRYNSAFLMAIAAGTRLGPYEIEAPLGAGGRVTSIEPGMFGSIGSLP